jgi:hypothetical protein
MQSAQHLLQNSNKTLSDSWKWWTGELSEIFNAFNSSSKNNRLQFNISRENGLERDPGTKNEAAKGLQNLSLKFNDNSIQYRKIKLPEAAARNIDKVVKYEFSKYFPMNFDDSLISSAIVPDTASRESIEVEIWSISKKLIERHLTQIYETYNIEAKKISILNSRDQCVITHDAIHLKGNHSIRKKNSISAKLLNFNLLILLIALLVYPVFKMDLYLQELENGVTLLEQEAKPVLETRNSIREEEARILKLIKIKEENPNQAYIWSRVTAIMADRVTLDKMEINGNDVKLEGKAPSAERIIKILEADKSISNVKIIGSVTPTGSGQEETLNVSMTINEINTIKR